MDAQRTAANGMRVEYAVCQARHRHVEELEREAWERARIVGVMSVSPWSGKSVDPKRILPLPWDRQTDHTEQPEQRPATREEARLAFEALMRRRREEAERRKEK